MENSVKTKRHILKPILLILLIVFIIFLIITMRKFIIITHLQKLSKNLNLINSSNYLAERYSVQGNTVMAGKTYKKDLKHLTTQKIMGTDPNNLRALTTYCDGNEQISIIQSGENKIAFLDGNTMSMQLYVNDISAYCENKLWYKILLSATTKITTEECNNKECYLIEFSKDYKIWFDKETGLVARTENGNNITNIYYQFDVVKDSDIQKPDISDCKIIE